MKILVTGASGLIGRSMYAELSTSSHQQLFTSRSRPAYIEPNDKSFIEADLTDFNSVKNIIADFRPDTIIHTAAMAAPDSCEQNREQAYNINVNATENLVRLSREFNAYLLFLSTDFVFDGEAGPYSESDTRRAVNYYGETKIKAEDIVFASGGRWAIARTVLNYYAQIPGLRPSFQEMVLENVRNKKTVELAYDQFRTPTYLPDLTKGLQHIAEKQLTGIFHLSGEDMISIYELGRMITRFAGMDERLIIPVPTSALKHQAQRPLRTGLVCTKAKNEFGYSATPLDEALQIILPKL